MNLNLKNQLLARWQPILIFSIYCKPLLELSIKSSMNKKNAHYNIQKVIKGDQTCFLMGIKEKH